MPQRGRGRAPLTPDARRILAVQALRAFVYGFGSVLIGVTLSRRGLSGVEVGLVLAALLAGSALASVLLARFGDRVGRRRWYLGLLAVMGIAGTVFALTGSVTLLVLAALTGTVSTDVVESGPFTSLEQSMLPRAAADEDPARLFGTYNVVATLAGSLGALAAGGPTLLDARSQTFLLAYPAASLLALVAAAGISTAVEVGREESRRPVGAPAAVAPSSRGAVTRLAGLFALDSFGGGFVTQAFVVYWFSEKFGTSQETLGVVFFAVGILQAASFAVAVRLGERIGLLNTMVFTHLPSNVLLACIAFAPTQEVAIALLLGRFALSQMDVPARQAFLARLVPADELTYAAATTNTARYVTRPVAPLVAGPLINVALGAPFVIAGALKSVYDVCLYSWFRRSPSARERVPANT